MSLFIVSLADLLLSEDSYLRERVAIIYGTIGRQAIGREAIFRYTKILCNLSKGLRDPLDAVRIKIARVIKNLAFNPIGWSHFFLPLYSRNLIHFIINRTSNRLSR